jgi:hypothetical protein
LKTTDGLILRYTVLKPSFRNFHRISKDFQAHFVTTDLWTPSPPTGLPSRQLADAAMRMMDHFFMFNHAPSTAMAAPISK